MKTQHERIISTLQTNHWLVQKQAEGLSHEDSLLQLPFRGNCFNWVLGHIIVSRHTMLQLVGESPLWQQPDLERYKRGSEPVTSPEQGLRFEQMLETLQTINERLVAALGRLSPADLEIVSNGDESTIGEQLEGLTWHETYHVGQTEILRQLAGKNDKVV